MKNRFWKYFYLALPGILVLYGLLFGYSFDNYIDKYTSTGIIPWIGSIYIFIKIALASFLIFKLTHFCSTYKNNEAVIDITYIRLFTISTLVAFISFAISFPVFIEGYKPLSMKMMRIYELYVFIFLTYISNLMILKKK